MEIQAAENKKKYEHKQNRTIHLEWLMKRRRNIFFSINLKDAENKEGPR